MKKLVLALVAVGLISTNLIAAVYAGKVTTVTTFQDGTVNVGITYTADGVLYDKPLIGTADVVKAMLATALTAQASDSDVDFDIIRIDGVSTWKYILVK